MVHMGGVGLITKIHIERKEGNNIYLSWNKKNICRTTYLPASSIKIVSIL
jgi:hypothetical protein